MSLREKIVNINNCRFSKQEVAASKQGTRQLLNTIIFLRIKSRLRKVDPKYREKYVIASATIVGLADNKSASISHFLYVSSDRVHGVVSVFLVTHP